jgi:hypothetical protein
MADPSPEAAQEHGRLTNIGEIILDGSSIWVRAKKGPAFGMRGPNGFVEPACHCIE